MIPEEIKRYTFDPEKGGEHDTHLYRSDALANYVEHINDITDEHIEFYREFGYLAVRHAFTAEEAQGGIDGLMHLINGGNPDFTGVQFERRVRDRLDTLTSDERQNAVRKLADFVEYDQRLKTLAYHPALLSVLERLIGDRPTLFQDMALMKPPAGGREKPWHQDKAFFNLQIDTPVVGVWIALDNAEIENGCMHIIPGSHREGPVVHFKRRDWQICDSDVQVHRDVVVPLPPGGCLFFDGLLQHGTPMNTSPKRRRAVQYHYTTPGAVWLDWEARMKVFGSEGKDVTC